MASQTDYTYGKGGVDKVKVHDMLLHSIRTGITQDEATYIYNGWAETYEEVRCYF